jgi:integrase
VKRLLNSIQASDVVSVRDKTLLIVLVGTAARASALARLRKVDYYSDGTQSSFSFDENGGKLHVVPARHDLQLQMKSYIKAAESKGQPDKSPLFPTAKKKKRSRRSRADGDSRSATKKVHQHESRSTRHRARGTRGGHGGVVGRMALA